MLLIFLGAMQITNCLSCATRQRTRLWKVALCFILALTIENRFSLFDSPRRRTGAADGDLGFAHPSVVQVERNRDANAWSLQIAKFQICVSGVRRWSRNPDLGEHFIGLE